MPMQPKSNSDHDRPQKEPPPAKAAAQITASVGHYFFSITFACRGLRRLLETERRARARALLAPRQLGGGDHDRGSDLHLLEEPVGVGDMHADAAV